MIYNFLNIFDRKIKVLGILFSTILILCFSYSLGVIFLSTMVNVKVCAGDDWGVEDGDDEDTVTWGGWG